MPPYFPLVLLLSFLSAPNASSPRREAVEGHSHRGSGKATFAGALRSDALVSGSATAASSHVPRELGTRVVVIVRHAEVAGAGADPPLSPEGLARAERLARIAASFDVEAAFVTPFFRTAHTARPAAEWLGLKPEVVPIASGVPAHVADLAERVQRASGTAALVVGHSNTVPDLILALTGQSVPPIGETQFNRLFIVLLPEGGTPTVEELTY